jgi:hypothetical protein
MKITSLNWLSKPAKEAELIVSDGVHSVTVFSQPCDYNIGDIIDEPLHVFMAKDIMLSKITETIIEKIDKGLGSFIVANIENLRTGICSVGNVKFQIEDEIPGGINLGDVIEFKCGRVDLW